MEKIFLYNEDFSFVKKTRNWIKDLLGKGPRGPHAVFDSLVTGLGELGYEVVVNDPEPGPNATVCVLSGLEALEWFLEQKQKGRISKIVAGPNLVVSPIEEQEVLLKNEIDTIVVPSPWVAEFYEKITPNIASKIQVWPAGVSLPEEPEQEKVYDFLVFNKLKDEKLSKRIEEYLSSQKYKIIFVQYGQYKQPQYFKALEKTKYMVYLSETESQGLAMFEAWARNVPTLVYERGFFKWGNTTVRGNTAAPYLTEQTGKRFKDFEQFKVSLHEFLQASYFPRRYIENNFTHKKCAENYLQIIS